MSSAHVLLTGYPGFLASALLTRMIRAKDYGHYTLLVLPELGARARAMLEELSYMELEFEGRWTVLEGDITRPRFGLDMEDWSALCAQTQVVWHLAALYDLSVSPKVAYQVNVLGTRHVLNLCQEAMAFDRLIYVSTCYVSGTRKGVIYEDELDRDQGHKNYYEETKFWAEVEVRRQIEHLGLDAMIFRPGIVVGDSRTGRTSKYDGPYYIFDLLWRLPSWLPAVGVGDGEAKVNLVPVDFATKAMLHIARDQAHLGQTFHIADPNPMRAKDVLSQALAVMGKGSTRGHLPPRLVDRAMKVERISEAVGVPRESFVYFNHDAHYDTTHLDRALAPTTLRCPHLSDVLPRLIEAMLKDKKAGHLARAPHQGEEF